MLTHLMEQMISPGDWFNTFSRESQPSVFRQMGTSVNGQYWCLVSLVFMRVGNPTVKIAILFINQQTLILKDLEISGMSTPLIQYL